MNKIINILNFIVIFLCLVLLIGSVDRFSRGMHNIDLGQNMRYLDAEYNLNLYDLASDGNYYSGTELYSLGLDQVYHSFYMIMFSSFGLGMFLLNLIKEKK